MTFLATVHAPQTGLLAAVGLGTLGALLLALQTGTAPPAHHLESSGSRVPMPWRRLLPIALAAVALGSYFGALEVATVAAAADTGHRSAAGVLLAGFALGSMAAGLAAGAIRWSTPDQRRFQVGMATLLVATLVLPYLEDPLALALVLFIAGMTLAPSLIAVTSLLEASTPRARLTEAMAVFQTGVSAGVAPGAWGAGVVADTAGGSASYWVCTVSAVSALVAALWARAAPPSGPSDDLRSEPVGGREDDRV